LQSRSRDAPRLAEAGTPPSNAIVTRSRGRGRRVNGVATVSRASSASLIYRPSPRPLEAPLTAQLRLSEAQADATCEHQRNPVVEAVLVESKFGRASFEIQFRIPLCGERMDRFQTRVGFGGEKEGKCLQKKTQLGDVRF